MQVLHSTPLDTFPQVVEQASLLCLSEGVDAAQWQRPYLRIDSMQYDSFYEPSFSLQSSIENDPFAAADNRITQTDSDLYSLPPREALYHLLKDGMIVVKHGRQSQPKRRMIRVDPNVTRLFWCKPPTSGKLPPTGAKSVYKSLALSEICEVRKGTDDDLTPNVKTKLRGTATLRRTCRPSDFNKCISIYLPTRTFDIQCLSEQDFTRLYDVLLRLWKEVPEEERPKIQPSSLGRTFSFY
jgi:hypothetical protein